MAQDSSQSETAQGRPFFPVPTTSTTSRHPEYDRFVQIIADLRSPNGCPWDLEQTHQSISKNMLEEAFEAVAAIEEGDVDHMREELGDVLMQVVLQSQIAQDNGEFTVEDVAHDVSEKLIRRHPHVYGPEAAFAALGVDPASIPIACDPFVASASSADSASFAPSVSSAASVAASSPATNASEVGDLWDVIKSIERQQKARVRAAKRAAAGLDPDSPRSLLDDVSKAQPALLEAHAISRRAVAQGFEWKSVDDVWAKVDEEIAEFKAAPSGSPEAELEFGDILFSLVNVARKEKINAESSLRRACAKFRARWGEMERIAQSEEKTIDDYDVDELQALWKRAKMNVG